MWKHFWAIATDAALARSMGVRVAQGEAVYKPVDAGQVFDFVVDEAGGISLSPVDRRRTAGTPEPLRAGD